MLQNKADEVAALEHALRVYPAISAVLRLAGLGMFGYVLRHRLRYGRKARQDQTARPQHDLAEVLVVNEGPLMAATAHFVALSGRFWTAAWHRGRGRPGTFSTGRDPARHDHHAEPDGRRAQQVNHGQHL